MLECVCLEGQSSFVLGGCECYDVVMVLYFQ